MNESGPPPSEGLHVRCPHCRNPIELVAEGSLAAIECDLEATYPGGDHDLFLGRVTAVWLGDTRKGPLVYHEGGYPKLLPDDRPQDAGAFLDSVRGFDARLQGFGRRRKRR